MLPAPRSDEPPQENVRRRALRIDISFATLFKLILVAAGAWLLVQLATIVLVLVVALMIVGTMNPAVQWLEARRIHRNAAIAIVFMALLVIVGLIITLTIPAFFEQVKNLINQEPVLRASVADYLAASPLTAFMARALRNFQYDTLIKSSMTTMLTLSMRIFEVLAYSVGAIFLALYMMVDRDRLRGALFALVPRQHHIQLSRILFNLQTIVGGYIRGQVITCALMGVFVFVLLTACGVPNAVALAVLGGVADLLPFVGAFLTMGPAVVAALAISPVVATVVFVVLLAYEEFESRVLIPVVYGRALRLPSSVVLFSLMTGATLMGIVGALLALPVAAAILMLLDELPVDLPGENELPGDAKQKLKDETISQEYERRTEGMPAEQAAAVAVKISEDQKKDGRNQADLPSK